jgi:hypothetical protein
VHAVAQGNAECDADDRERHSPARASRGEE